MATFVPTTIIGLGTSGCRTISWLSRLLYQEFGSEVPPFIRLVALDTAKDSLVAEHFSSAIEARPINLQAPIDVTWHTLKDHGIEQWFSASARQRVQRIDASKGAGNVRAVGRMCLWSHLPQSIFSNRADEDGKHPYALAKRNAAAAMLSAKLGVPVLPEEPDPTRPGSGHYIRHTEHQYYIIGSATGGTASGSIVDLAHMAASMHVNGNAPTVVVLLTLPPESLQGADGLGVNVAAALIDIADLVLRPASVSDTVREYPNGRRPTARAESPASAVYLLGPSAPGSKGAQMVFTCQQSGDVQEGLAMISAYWLYASLFGMGAHLHLSIADYQQRLNNLGDKRTWPENKATLRSFALGGAARPTWLLAELVTRRLLEQQTLRWTTAEASRSDAWLRGGREWMNGQIDKELSDFAVAVSRREAETQSTSERKSGAHQRVQEVYHADLVARHTFALGRAREGASMLRDVVMRQVDTVIDENYSLLAGQRFLDGVVNALEERAADWQLLDVDCSGRDASVDGASDIIDKRLRGYESPPPTWLGGPSRTETLREALRDLASWLAAFYLAPQIFAPGSTSTGRSVRADTAARVIDLNAAKSGLERLQVAWERRELTITNVDTNARGTIALVWYDEGDKPAEAADKVTARIVAEGGIDAVLRSALPELSRFVKLTSSGQQEQELLERWTGAVVLPRTRSIVRDVSLADTMAAKAEVRTLLCLNRNFASRKYFSPIAGNEFELPPKSYHITGTYRKSRYELVEGSSDLLRDLDLKYEEAVGFTLFDVEHFRTWLGRLLRSPGVLDENDPYKGIRRYLAQYVETTVRLVRDLLVDWNTESLLPERFWSELRIPTNSVLQLKANEDVLIRIDGQTLSVGLSWREACAHLCENPARFQMLVEELQQTLKTISLDTLQARWAEIEPVLASRYPNETLDIGRLAIQYGVRSPTGDVAHLFSY